MGDLDDLRFFSVASLPHLFTERSEEPPNQGKFKTQEGLSLYLTHIHLREYDNNDTSTTKKRQKKRNLTSCIIRESQPHGGAG
jgi:hypothetical protein